MVYMNQYKMRMGTYGYGDSYTVNIVHVHLKTELA